MREPLPIFGGVVDEPERKSTAASVTKDGNDKSEPPKEVESEDTMDLLDSLFSNMKGGSENATERSPGKGEDTTSSFLESFANGEDDASLNGDVSKSQGNFSTIASCVQFKSALNPFPSATGRRQLYMYHP